MSRNIMAHAWSRRKLLLLLTAGCSAPVQTELAPRPPIHDMRNVLAHGRKDAGVTRFFRRGASHLADLAERPRAYAGESVLSGLGPDMTGWEVDMSLGSDLSEALEEADPDLVATYGPGALDTDELFPSGYIGDDSGACEAPSITTTFTEDDTTWEARLEVASYFPFVGDITPVTVTLDPTCREALAAAGDVDSAGCDDEMVQAFFPEGGACRTCVEGNGGDVTACEEAESCPVETTQVAHFSGGGADWYYVANGYTWACAPDWVSPVTFGYTSADGSLPETFDHTGWGFICFPFYDESSGEVESYCFDGAGGPELGDTVGEGLAGRVTYIREEGESGTPHAERLYYLHSVGLDIGVTLDRFWGESTGGMGIVSLPLVYSDGNGDGVIDGEDWSTGTGGWGVPPKTLRLDGTDPTVLDDTLARDWLGAVTMKTATTIAGVPVNIINHSRCLNWEGPADDGSWTCTETDWPTPGWQEDTENFWYDRAMTQIISLPMATLASTGLPDPLVPGGFVPYVAGSEDLANPEWDGCTWPHSFVPDHLRAEDDPFDFDASHSLDGATYKFGKDEDDIRILMTTARPRSFCPEG